MTTIYVASLNELAKWGRDCDQVKDGSLLLIESEDIWNKKQEANAELCQQLKEKFSIIDFLGLDTWTERQLFQTLFNRLPPDAVCILIGKRLKGFANSYHSKLKGTRRQIGSGTSFQNVTMYKETSASPSMMAGMAVQGFASASQGSKKKDKKRDVQDTKETQAEDSLKTVPSENPKKTVSNDSNKKPVEEAISPVKQPNQVKGQNDKKRESSDNSNDAKMKDISVPASEQSSDQRQEEKAERREEPSNPKKEPKKVSSLIGDFLGEDAVPSDLLRQTDGSISKKDTSRRHMERHTKKQDHSTKALNFKNEDKREAISTNPVKEQIPSPVQKNTSVQNLTEEDTKTDVPQMSERENRKAASKKQETFTTTPKTADKPKKGFFSRFHRKSTVSGKEEGAVQQEEIPSRQNEEKQTGQQKRPQDKRSAVAANKKGKAEAKDAAIKLSDVVKENKKPIVEPLAEAQKEQDEPFETKTTKAEQQLCAVALQRFYMHLVQYVFDGNKEKFLFEHVGSVVDLMVKAGVFPPDMQVSDIDTLWSVATNDFNRSWGVMHNNVDMQLSCEQFQKLYPEAHFLYELFVLLDKGKKWND